MSVQAFDRMQIPEHSFGTRDTLKKLILPEHLASTFSIVTPFSNESEHTKLMIPLIISLPLAVFYLQSLSCEVIDKSQRGLNFQQQVFPLCIP